MRVTIFAATGGIGAQLLDQAIAAGHEVTAAVRTPGKLVGTAARVVQADLTAQGSAMLEPAVAGADAVLSGLGPRSLAEAGVAERGTHLIVKAMELAGAKRLVVVSAAPLGTVASPLRPNPPKHDPGDGFFMRHVFSPLTRVALRKHYDDLARMEDVLYESDLDWTIVRPPRLTNGPMTGAYRTAYGRNLRGGFLISRADVAHCMLASLARPETIRQVIGLAN